MNLIESTLSAAPPPDALAVAKAVTFEYPPTEDAGVNALAPSAAVPFVTT